MPDLPRVPSLVVIYLSCQPLNSQIQIILLSVKQFSLSGYPLLKQYSILLKPYLQFLVLVDHLLFVSHTILPYSFIQEGYLVNLPMNNSVQPFNLAY